MDKRLRIKTKVLVSVPPNLKDLELGSELHEKNYAISHLTIVIIIFTVIFFYPLVWEENYTLHFKYILKLYLISPTPQRHPPHLSLSWRKSDTTIAKGEAKNKSKGVPRQCIYGRCSHLEVLGVLKNDTKLTGKHLLWSLFYNKVAFEHLFLQKTSNGYFWDNFCVAVSD